jgi:hypothetical protein
VAEYPGRYTNTGAGATRLRFGMNSELPGIGLLDASLVQSDLHWERPFTDGDAGNLRNDLDLSLSGGRRWRGDYREAALWYVRSRWEFPGGTERGGRLGMRLQYEPRVDTTHHLLLRADAERTFALFQESSSGRRPGGSRLVGGLTAADTWNGGGLLTGKLALRFEGARFSPDGGGENRSYARAGGALAAEYGDSLGPGLFAGLSRAWRWASLDETFGFWSRDRPNRFMDLTEVESGISKVYGDPSLGPVETNWAGGGLRWLGGQSGSVRFQFGLRQWEGVRAVQRAFYSVYVRRRQPGFTTLETILDGRLQLPGPFSAAAAATVSEAGREQPPMPERWGWASLRYNGEFFNGQLRLLADVTLRHWGAYDTGEFSQEAVNQLDATVSMRIISLELYYSMPNLNGQPYTYAPGYPGIHTSEIWGFRWILLN